MARPCQGVWPTTHQRCDRPSPTSPILPTELTDIWRTADDELFSKVVRMNNHVLHTLLPQPTIASQNYNLRHRTHQLQLSTHTTQLAILCTLDIQWMFIIVPVTFDGNVRTTLICRRPHWFPSTNLQQIFNHTFLERSYHILWPFH